MSFKKIISFFAFTLLFRNSFSNDIIAKLLQPFAKAQLDSHAPMYVCIKNSNPEEFARLNNDFLRVILAEEGSKKSATLVTEDFPIKTITSSEDEEETQAKEENQNDAPYSDLPSTNFNYCHYTASDISKFNDRRKVIHYIENKASQTMYIGTNQDAWCHFVIEIDIPSNEYDQFIDFI